MTSSLNTHAEGPANIALSASLKDSGGLAGKPPGRGLHENLAGFRRQRQPESQPRVRQSTRDRRRPSRSIPAGMVPDGLAPAEAMMLAGESSAPRAKSVREQLLERELGSGESMVFHSFGPDEEA
jgi:hypothetical protein